MVSVTGVKMVTMDTQTVEVGGEFPCTVSTKVHTVDGEWFCLQVVVVRVILWCRVCVILFPDSARVLPIAMVGGASHVTLVTMVTMWPNLAK